MKNIDLGTNGCEIALDLWNHLHVSQYSEIQLARFTRAFHYAITLHSNKPRKSGESYYRHDCRAAVRALLISGIDLAIIMLVHEFIEDDDWLYEQLVHEFGESTAIVVDAISKRPRDKFLSRQDRIADHVERMRKVMPLHPDVALAKAIDRLENTSDTAGLNDVDKKRLFDETKEIFLPYFLESSKHIPVEKKSIYDLIVLEIKFNCDNYWRSRALQS